MSDDHDDHGDDHQTIKAKSRHLHKQLSGWAVSPHLPYSLVANVPNTDGSLAIVTLAFGFGDHGFMCSSHHRRIDEAPFSSPWDLLVASLASLCTFPS